jgi:hypothetical protein
MLSNKDYGIAPHTDYGCLTILLTDNNPGLEIKNPSDEWELVLPKEDEIIVNFGDMLEFWSNQKSRQHLTEYLETAMRDFLFHFSLILNMTLLFLRKVI